MKRISNLESRQPTLVVTLLFFIAAALPAWAESKWNPVADPRAVIVEGAARFTVLTPRLIRMEWAPDRTFEDHASLVFVNRRLPVPDFKTTHEDGLLLLRTSAVTVHYKQGEFTSTNLRADFVSSRSDWYKSASARAGFWTTGSSRTAGKRER